MSYKTNLVSFKEEVLDQLHEKITPLPTEILDINKVEDVSDFTTPVIKEWYSDTVYNKHAIVRLWKEYDSEVEGGILQAEVYNPDLDELYTGNLEEIADLEELVNLLDYLNELPTT